MQNLIIKQSVLNPADRELVQAIKKATCQYFDITEERLMEDSTPTVANIRFLCFWLIGHNTHLKDYMIGQAFDKARSSVLYGVSLIDAHKDIYRQTLDNLKGIARIADNFEKNYSWHILPISTKH
jgi:chromosomal replication initiation ATPase DnaA